MPYPLALTTAAHSTVRAWCASARQFAAMAARSMINVPPVSGSTSVSAGSGSGSASAMVGFMAAAAAVVKEVPGKCGLVTRLQPPAEVAEACYSGLELQLYCAGRTMALFADDKLGFSVRLGNLLFEIIFLAEYEHHHVGVLLDRARLAQIGKLRPLVVAVLDLSRQLGQGQDRDVEFLGERFEPGGDLGDFLNAVFGGAAAVALQELNVVDHQEIEAALALEPARPRRQLADRETAGLVDVKRQVLQLDRDVLDSLEVALVDAAAADLVRRNTGLLGNDTGGELFGRHFQREETDYSAVDGFSLTIRADVALRKCLGDIVGDVGGKRRLAHAGAAGKDDEIGVLQAAHAVVEVGQSSGEAG